MIGHDVGQVIDDDGNWICHQLEEVESIRGHDETRSKKATPSFPDLDQMRFDLSPKIRSKIVSFYNKILQ